MMPDNNENSEIKKEEEEEEGEGEHEGDPFFFDPTVDDDGKEIKDKEDIYVALIKAASLPLLTYVVRSFCVAVIIYFLNLNLQIGFIPILLFTAFFPSGRKELYEIYYEFKCRLVHFEHKTGPES